MPLAPRSEVLHSYLNSVSCASRRFCFAVGSSTDETGATYTALAEMWNGDYWSVLSGPSASWLSGVSCVDRSFCMVSGDGIMERFNGSSWTATSIPSFDAPFGVGSPAVSCVRASFGVATAYTRG